MPFSREVDLYFFVCVFIVAVFMRLSDSKTVGAKVVLVGARELSYKRASLLSRVLTSRRICSAKKTLFCDTNALAAMWSGMCRHIKIQY